MNIELIKKEAEGEKKDDIILFVHGAWHAAWSWEKYYMDYFAKEGYDNYALSFRGHGKSDSEKGINFLSINDYTKDLVDVVRKLEKEPIIIAHCMGGLVLQKFLENNSCKKAILMGSIPPQGALRTILNVTIKRLYALPNILMLNLHGLVSKPARAKWALFSDKIEDSELEEHTSKLGSESFRVFLEMIFPRIKVNYHTQIPMLVVGGQDDNIITVNEAKKTASKYNADIKIIKNVAHNLMLDVENKNVATEIINWLNA